MRINAHLVLNELKFKQRMPLKPVKIGIKMLLLPESQSGYCHKFQVHLGREGDDEANSVEFGKTGLVVVQWTRAHGFFLNSRFLFIYL